MIDLILSFEGYWIHCNRSKIPHFSGVYIVYSSVFTKDKRKLKIKRIIYIGSSCNVNKRLLSHEKYNEWSSLINKNEMICYSVARCSNFLVQVESALIYYHQPPVNIRFKNNLLCYDINIKICGSSIFLTENVKFSKSRIR